MVEAILKKLQRIHIHLKYNTNDSRDGWSRTQKEVQRLSRFNFFPKEFAYGYVIS